MSKPRKVNRRTPRARTAGARKPAGSKVYRAAAARTCTRRDRGGAV